MLQRQIGNTSYNRQSSCELLASGRPKSISRNNSFSRRNTGQAPIPQSRSRASLLVSCSAPSWNSGGADAELPPQLPSTPSASETPQRSLPAHRDAADPAAPHAPSPRPQPSASASSPRLPQSPSASLGWDFSDEAFVPSPSNLPTGAGPEYDAALDRPAPGSGLDGEALLYPPRGIPSVRSDLWTLTDQPGIDLFLAGPLMWGRLRQVYVILFGVGQRDTEGIYSLRAFAPDGIPHETIIAFECEDDAQRYAGLLEASMDHRPSVCAIPPRELLTFCMGQDYSCRLEPASSLLIPPDYNVTVTDWERSLRLREGQFAVLEAEPELHALSGGSSGGGGGVAGSSSATATAQPSGSSGSGGSGHALLQPRPGNGGSGGSGASSRLARYSGLAGGDLDAVRARLEELLPR